MVVNIKTKEECLFTLIFIFLYMKKKVLNSTLVNKQNNIKSINDK